MKKIMLGLVTALALTSFVAPAFAEDAAAPAPEAKKEGKKGKKAKKDAAAPAGDAAAAPAGDAAKK